MAGTGAAPPPPTSASSPGALAEPERFPFVQLVVAGATGLDDARYLARDPDRVVVVRVAGSPAPAPRRLRRRPPRDADPDPGAPAAPVTTLTVISAEPLGSETEAAGWLERLRSDPEAAAERIADAAALANLVVHARRAAGLDPGLAEVAPEHALAVRIGYGAGERVADGRWEHAIEVPREERRRRLEALRPQERIAAALAGERPVPPEVALVLRARADLDAGRDREAALELDAGLSALLASSSPGPADAAAAVPAGEAGERQAADLGELEAAREGVGGAAAAARAGEVPAAGRAAVAAALEVAERVLRRALAAGG